MSKYDPQRDRPRRRPADDEPAPVDALLGGDARPSVGVPDADPVPDVPEPVTAVTEDPLPYAPAPPPQAKSVHVHGALCDHGHDHDHDHDHDHHHDHDGHVHGPGPLARTLSTLAVVTGVVFALRWWRRRRSA